jgi:hypothetical protein
MTMPTKGLLIGLCLGALLPAQDVKYNFDKEADFSKYKTYAWTKISGAEEPNQLTDQQIRQAIDEQLSKKGLTKTEQHPDLLVAYQISMQKEKELNTFGDTGPWGYGRGWGGMGTITTSTIQVGTLVLDIYDPAQKQLIWRGSATKTLDPSNDPDKNYKRLQKSAEKLTKNFPPPMKN